MHYRGARGSRRYIRRAVEGSLRRLGTDRIDLYQMHSPDPATPELVSAQPEFTTPMWDYIDLRASPRRITNGKAAMEANAPLFADIGKRYGVEPHLLGAIWGIETNYGSVLGDTKIIRPIVRSLATLVRTGGTVLMNGERRRG